MDITVDLGARGDRSARVYASLRGAILDVVVDIRQGSPSYGQHVAVEIRISHGGARVVGRALHRIHRAFQVSRETKNA